MDKEKNSIAEMLAKTLIGRVAKGTLEAAKLPGDVYSGKVVVIDEDGNTSPELIERAAGLAGLTTGGAAMVPMQPGTLRAGMSVLSKTPSNRKAIAEILARMQPDGADAEVLRRK